MKIAINGPSLGREEARAVSAVLKSGQLTSAASTGGRHVREFERAAASYVGARYAVAVNSGTAALQASLHALDIKKGDEVLIPSFTFVATANAVASTGARPVFVDITGDDYTMDPDDLAKKITKKTRAIIPVHLYGNVAPVEEISEIASRHGLPVVEDSAQSLGSTLGGRHTGTFFDMGCFSMYPAKVVTAGEGGFVVTGDRDLRDRLLMIRNHGLAPDGTAGTFGLNLRLPEIGAAIASIQLKKLPGFLRARRRNADRLTGLISGLDIRIPGERRRTRVNWYLYTIAAPGRDRILEKLNRRGIGATPYYPLPVHRTAPHGRPARLPVTDWASAHVLSLPVHPGVTAAGIESIARALRGAV